MYLRSSDADAGDGDGVEALQNARPGINGFLVILGRDWSVRLRVRALCIFLWVVRWLLASFRFIAEL